MRSYEVLQQHHSFPALHPDSFSQHCAKWPPCTCRPVTVLNPTVNAALKNPKQNKSLASFSLALSVSPSVITAHSALILRASKLTLCVGCLAWPTLLWSMSAHSVHEWAGWCAETLEKRINVCIRKPPHLLLWLYKLCDKWSWKCFPPLPPLGNVKTAFALLRKNWSLYHQNYSNAKCMSLFSPLTASTNLSSMSWQWIKAQADETERLHPFKGQSVL